MYERPKARIVKFKGSSREALLYEECATWTPLKGQHYYHDNKLRTVHHRMMMIIMTMMMLLRILEAWRKSLNSRILSPTKTPSSKLDYF